MLMETVKAKTKIYDQVVEKVKKMIASGELPQGSALPAERQLIEDLNVSRSSLREGFRILEMMGFIESIPGKGRFVRKSRGEGSQSGRVPLQDEAILELVEARLVLEPAIAVEAAKHASPSDLTRIRRILTKTGKDVESLEHRAQCDYDFHLVLAESTHNFIFVNIVKMTFNLIIAPERDSSRRGIRGRKLTPFPGRSIRPSSRNSAILQPECVSSGLKRSIPVPRKSVPHTS